MSIKLLPANQLESLTKLSTNLCNCSVLNVFHVRCAAQTFDRPSYVVERYHFGGKDIMVGSTIVSPVIVIPTILSSTIVSPTIVGPYQLRKC